MDDLTMFAVNATFRVLPEAHESLLAGVYRVILDSPRVGQTVIVLIESYQDEPPDGDSARRAGKKKPPPPLVGKLIWVNRSDLERLADAHLLKHFVLERRNSLEISESSKKLYERRVQAMRGFLDLENLHESIVVHKGLSGLVAEAIAQSGVSSTFVYRLWSTLCRSGLVAQSLATRLHECGAPGVRRPCDPRSDGAARRKAGRKTVEQRIALQHGKQLEPAQPGMTSEWAAAIRAADARIKAPKPSWPMRHKRIVESAFCGRAIEVDGRIEMVKPEAGQYPNLAQVKRVLTVDKSDLERLLEKTTQRHFESALRGLRARNWRDVAGPGHTWAIDSTIGDIYLRSSINRAWILGRPIVYVIVDVWSTAVVGFYVCLSGPSWQTAKVALFNASADPNLIAECWGYQPMLSLNPSPTLSYALLCDRGEYLSQGHRSTAQKLLPMTQYAPPYRGDLKGLVEVLHRIEKDATFGFIPGAINYRREELELRKVDPRTAVFTVREYVHYLHELFTDYNLRADRAHRIDAHMVAAGVIASPAGLWRFGHAAGIGFRRELTESDLIAELLPSTEARVRRDAIRHAGCDYSSPEIEQQRWTTTARSLGGWDINVHYYPGSMASIWTPQVGGRGMLKLQLSDQARAPREVTLDEWSDVLAIETMERSGADHERTMHAIDSWRRLEELKKRAIRLTHEALRNASGASPTMTEARALEMAEVHPSQSERDTTSAAPSDAAAEHQALLRDLIQASNREVDRRTAQTRSAPALTISSPPGLAPFHRMRTPSQR